MQKVPPSPAPSIIWTWDQVKDRFQLNNTTVMASKLNIDEFKADEITAHLRPNPNFTLSADGTQIAPSHGASLLDFFNAESDYRNVQLSYVNLIGAYLTAAAQLNQAVGGEVIQ